VIVGSSKDFLFYFMTSSYIGIWKCEKDNHNNIIIIILCIVAFDDQFYLGAFLKNSEKYNKIREIPNSN
jgi:hypothetical protein